MKKLLTVLVLTLAMNFLAAAGAVGWLYRSGHLDKTRIGKIRELMFPPPAPPVPPASENATPTTQPVMQLSSLLSRRAGLGVAEQVDFIQHTFDAQMLELDRRHRDLDDLKRQVDLANKKLAADRQELETKTQALAARENEADRLQTDKGFQDSLLLYSSIPAKQVKTIFLTLSQTTVEQYLDAMPPRTAAKIIKEFKSPAETAFIQQVLESMRQAQPAADVQK